MAYVTLLVSEQRMKQWTQLDENVRLEDITPFIINAQDIYMQTSLGTSFYKRIKAGVQAMDLDADELELLNDYIGPTLMQYALYLMLPAIKYKIVDKGILSGTSEETGSTTLEELKYLRQTTLDLAQFYDQRLREYLRQNQTLFPLYLTPDTLDGMLPNRQTPYFSGLVTNTTTAYGKKKENYWCDACQNDGCNCGYIEIV